MGKWTDEALRMKPFFQKGAQSLDDAEALEVKGIYEQWKDLVERGETVLKGYIFAHGTDLYRVEQPEYTFTALYVPGDVGTESLFSHIDEEHTGTINDPIPYDGNMALVAGLYYVDDGVVYICTRDTVNPVYAPLKDLVPLYVEVVE